MMIRVFSNTKTCFPCQELHAWLKENDIEFEDKDMGTADTLKRIEIKKEFMKLGFSHIPVVIIGDEVVHGFDKEKISQLLGL